MRIRDWSSTFALPISRSLAWFDEERIGSRCDFPGHGITQRHMLDHFILGEDDFRGDAEHARNLIDLPIILVRFTNPVIEHSRMGRFFGNRRRRSQRLCSITRFVKRTTMIGTRSEEPTLELQTLRHKTYA